MLGHLSFGVADLARTAAFYDPVLGALGYARVFTASYAVGYGLAGTSDDRLLLILQPEPVIPQARVSIWPSARPAARPWTVSTRPPCIRRHRPGCAGSRPDYGADYYAAFVLDPDGYKLEAKHPPPAIE